MTETTVDKEFGIIYEDYLGFHFERFETVKEATARILEVEETGQIDILLIEVIGYYLSPSGKRY